MVGRKDWSADLVERLAGLRRLDIELDTVRHWASAGNSADGLIQSERVFAVGSAPDLDDIRVEIEFVDADPPVGAAVVEGHIRNGSRESEYRLAFLSLTCWDPHFWLATRVEKAFDRAVAQGIPNVHVQVEQTSPFPIDAERGVPANYTDLPLTYRLLTVWFGHGSLGGEADGLM